MLLRNYYRTAVRSIARSRFNAIINIIGLSTGIAFTLLIAAFCWSEKRVNHQLKNADRQCLLCSDWKDPSLGNAITTTGQLARALRENYPSLVANFYRWDGITSAISYGDKHFREGIQLGDSTVLQMYGFTLLQGDLRTALNNPFSAVISDEEAMKFFGRTDVVGKDLTIDNFSGSRQDFRITGVLKNPSRNSVTALLDPNGSGIFVPSSNLAFFGRNMDWANPSIVSYVELQKGVKPEALDGPITHLLKVNTGPSVQANLRVIPTLLTDYYLDANGGTGRKMIYTLSFIALFILVMAIINFINLSVSRSSLRMREIGVRKVLGGLRRQLRRQFLTESILLALASTVVALVWYQLMRPLFAGMLGNGIPSLSSLPAIVWGIILLFAVFVGWLAGLYPATLLSSLSSIDALKGKEGTVRERVILRKGLVGFQFATATTVFIAAIIVSQQISLFFSDQLGYNKEYIISAQLPRDWSLQGVRKMSMIRDVFARMPEVKDATLSYSIPNGNLSGGIGLYRQGEDSTTAIVADQLVSDEHYASTYQIPLAGGVFFNAPGGSAAQDPSRMVLNEMATKALGWQRAQDAVGQRLSLVGFPNVFTVSGVVKDFHFNVMGAPLRPQFFVHVSGNPFYRFLSFKLRPGNVAAAIGVLQKRWAELMPGAPFEYSFMDETLRSLYTTELRLRKAATMATGLAFLIVLLGVIGLVSSSIQRRTKEIAIRKVIGASVPGIIRLFLREYLPVLLVAGLVASPLAYWVLQSWLDGYATRITITPWPFIEAIGCLAVIMVVLIATQTFSAASANPVKSLKIN
jgi:putative ABC transport system permease protein